MHNLISHNQLAAWNELGTTLGYFIDQHEIVNSYFECLSECDENTQSCKKVCRSILKDL
jgi:hypothetical protein